ncbi:AAA family ATPase [Pelotomaculum propionicicum]|uniref:AAA family ATPase n=1 Tax=Pelotomaculum propionicicum TaxID=258475 RepID=UPI003B7CE998
MGFSIRVFIVSPDQETTNTLVEQLSKVEDIEIVGESSTRESTLNIVGEFLPNVVLIDEDVEDGPYGLSEEITQRFVNMAVIIIGKPTQEDYLRKLLQVGARDFIDKPVEPTVLVEAIYRAHEYEKKRKVLLPSVTVDETRVRKAKIISVFSNKGGIGTTTIAVNLAVTLAKYFQRRTLLWDLDLYHGIVAVATNVVQRRHLTDLLNEIQYMDEELFESYLERHESGLAVLPAPFTPEFGDFVSAEHVSRILAVARERWDYIIIDNPSFFNEPTIAALRQSDMILIVGSLDLGTIKNIKACLMVMDKLNFSRAKIKLVVNRVGREFGIFPKDIETTLKIPVFATIPADAKSVLTGLNQGVPAAISSPDTDFGRSIHSLAKIVSGGKEAEKPAKVKKGMFGRVFDKNAKAGGQ